MKRLIKLFVLQTIFCLLFAETTFAQLTQSTIVITPPDTLGACMPNVFVAKVKSNGAKLTIAQHINMGTNTVSCIDTGVYVIADSIVCISGSVTSPIFDTITKKWSATINSADTVTIYYRVNISCGIIPSVGTNINNIKLEQTFTDANNSFTYTIAPSASNMLSTDIAVPLIIDRSPATPWNASYLDTLDVFYYYANGGNANARINFTFNEDTSHYCSNLQQLSLAYKNGSGNFVNYTSGTPLSTTLDANDTLIFRSRNKVIGCPNTACPNANVVFTWNCNIPAPAANHFCTSCRGSGSTPYYLNPLNSPQIHFTRTLPATLPDYSCMNNAFVTWRYVVTNNGVGAMDTATISFGNTAFTTAEYLSLIDTASLTVTPIGCSNCNLKITKYVNSNALCTGAVNTALSRATIQLTDFKKTDTLIIQFTTYRCVEDNIVLLNTDKYYNRWAFGVTGNTICGNNANGAFGTWPYNQGQIDRNAGANKADVVQELIFVPQVSDLSVPPGQSYGDSVKMEIEMKGIMGEPFDYTLLNCPNGSNGCNMQGWVRAMVHCDQNLIVPTPAIGLRLRWLNPATNLYVYKTPDLFHTSIQPNECRPADYYYYFNLNDTLMRVMLDSGVCEFMLRACCDGDIARTPYSVTFHLVADPSGNCNSLAYNIAQDTVLCSGVGCGYLPLSGIGGLLAVHCPGCKKVGIISDYYKINRTSFGLTDTRNIGVADTNAQTITPGSAWFQLYGDRLRTNFSSFGDELEDRLVAHCEPGDPSSGGYDLAMLNQRGAYLKQLQLSRLITAAFDTMKLSVTGFTLYIDAPNTANPNCINCTEFERDTLGFRTQHIISVTGNNIYHFLDTITNANHFLFNFSAYDSASSYYGNLYDQSFTSYYYTDTLDTLKGFFENQRYRLHVTYRECGSFAAPIGSNLNLEDYLKQSLILNKMWLSGKKQIYSAFDDNKGSPNTIAELDSAGWTFNPLDSTNTLISQQFADSFIFVCETFGAYHYFFSQNAYNGSGYASDTSCEKTIILRSELYSAGKMQDFYPFEYKLPAYEPLNYTVNIPSGYHTVAGSGRVQYYSYYGIANGILTPTPKRHFTVPSGSGTITIADNTLPQGVCMYADSRQANGQWFPNDSNLYVAGYNIIKFVTFNIAPDVCPADSFKLQQNDVAINYHAASYNCQPSGVCDTLFNTVLYTSTGVPSKPNLSINYIPSVTATQHKVCMNFTYSNNKTAQRNYSEAPHVYAVIPTNAPYLTNWQYSINGGTPQPVVGGVVPVKDTLRLDNSINLQLCADYINCITQDSAEMKIYWGWNCDGYPVLPFYTDSVCFADSSIIYFKDAEEQVSPTVKVHDSTYTLCRNFEVSTEVKNVGNGAVYPISVLLDSLASSLQVQHILITNCSDSTKTDTLTNQIAFNTWAIAGSNMAAAGFPDSAIGYYDCMIVRAILKPTCDYLNVNSLPNLVVTMLNLCNDTIVKTAFRLYNVNSQSNDTIIWNDSSDCEDCFSIAKTASADTVAIGDTVTFTIQVCSHNAANDSLYLTEILPSSTVFTFISSTPTFPYTNNNFAADTCINYTVKGKYKSAGSCPDALFTNTVTLTSGIASYTDSVCVNVINLCANTDTTFADSTFSGITTNSTTTINGKSILVAGRYYVNNVLNLNNCTVYTAAGAQIIVQGTGTFNTNNTTIQSCDTMWQGANVLANGKMFVLNNSKIKDANNGIFANYGATVTVDSSSILDCVTGIYVPPNVSGLNTTVLNVSRSEFALQANAFKPNYTGQPTHGKLPKAGIEVFNMIMTLGGTTGKNNRFYNVNNGIVAHNSQLTVRRSQFYTIAIDSVYTDVYRGYAIVCDRSNLSDLTTARLTVLPEVSSYNTVNNCYRGIYTKGASFNVNYIHLLNVKVGMYSEAAPWLSTNTVSNCTITASNHGLFFISNPLASFIAADYNTITINGVLNPNSPSKPAFFAIHMRESFFGNVRYSASGNIINMTNAQYGIYSGFLNRASIKFNNIRFTGVGSGIMVQSNTKSSVSCNTVNANYSSGLGTSIGINVGNLSSSTLMYCNSVDSTYRGVFFGGPNPGTYLKGTEFHHHFNGLYLNTSSNISLQPMFGNRWNNTTWSFQAENANTNGYANSIFFVDTTLSNVYKPSNNIPGQSGWFQHYSGYTFYCSGTSICTSPPPALAVADLEEMIATGSLESVDYAEESQAIAEEYLYRTLEEDSNLILEDSAYVQFMLEKQDDAVGYLYDAEEYMRAAYQSDSVYLNLIDSCYHRIDVLKDSITYLEGNQPANFETIHDQLIFAIEFIAQTIQNIQIQREATMSGNLADAQLINDLVIPDNLPQENTQYINDIEIHYQESGYNIDVIRESYTGIFAIASQCPYAGGPAVERARAFIALLNDSASYDDDNVCLQSGIYRTAGVDSSNSKNDFKAINIQPNPANDKVTINLIGKFEGLCNIEIKNTLGKTVLQKQMNCKEAVSVLDISAFAPGIYTIKINVNNSNFINSKLVVVR
jgi:uncharacterized repeat protein (TIGR01451 family)